MTRDERANGNGTSAPVSRRRLLATIGGTAAVGTAGCVVDVGGLGSDGESSGDGANGGSDGGSSNDGSDGSGSDGGSDGGGADGDSGGETESTGTPTESASQATTVQTGDGEKLVVEHPDDVDGPIPWEDPDGDGAVRLEYKEPLGEVVASPTDIEVIGWASQKDEFQGTDLLRVQVSAVNNTDSEIAMRELDFEVTLFDADDNFINVTTVHRELDEAIPAGKSGGHLLDLRGAPSKDEIQRYEIEVGCGMGAGWCEMPEDG